MSKHNEHSIKEAIDLLMKAYKLDDKLLEKKVIASWKDIMGDMIAKHTTDMYIKNQQLFVFLDSPALKNELLLAKSKIIKMLNDAAGKEVINEIIFK